MVRQFTEVDVELSQLARGLFDQFNKAYVELGKFRGDLTTEMLRAPDRDIQKALAGVDRLISKSQDDLDKALEQLRQMAPGTILLTLGRKPHYLPGR